MEKKLTKKEKFEMIKGYVKDNEILMDFIEHEIELLDKKAGSKSKADIAKEQLNNELTKIVLNALYEIGKPVCIKDLQLQVVELSPANGISGQKISYLMQKLIKEDKVERTVEKRIVYYAIKGE